MPALEEALGRGAEIGRAPQARPIGQTAGDDLGGSRSSTDIILRGITTEALAQIDRVLPTSPLPTLTAVVNRNASPIAGSRPAASPSEFKIFRKSLTGRTFHAEAGPRLILTAPPRQIKTADVWNTACAGAEIGETGRSVPEVFSSPQRALVDTDLTARSTLAARPGYQRAQTGLTSHAASGPSPTLTLARFSGVITKALTAGQTTGPEAARHLPTIGTLPVESASLTGAALRRRESIPASFRERAAAARTLHGFKAEFHRVQTRHTAS